MNVSPESILLLVIATGQNCSQNAVNCRRSSRLATTLASDCDMIDPASLYPDLGKNHRFHVPETLRHRSSTGKHRQAFHFQSTGNFIRQVNRHFIFRQAPHYGREHGYKTCELIFIWAHRSSFRFSACAPHLLSLIDLFGASLLLPLQSCLVIWIMLGTTVMFGHGHVWSTVIVWSRSCLVCSHSLVTVIVWSQSCLVQQS